LFFLFFFSSSTGQKPNNQANFIFLPADPLQSFHNNWIHALTLFIEVEKVIAIKLFQAIVDQCTYQKHNIKSNKDFDSPPLLFSLEPFFFSVYHAKGNKKRRK